MTQSSWVKLNLRSLVGYALRAHPNLVADRMDAFLAFSSRMTSSR
jgi:hypothetical protein